MTPEMEALKARLKATWTSGDDGHFATYLEPGALELLEQLWAGNNRASDGSTCVEAEHLEVVAIRG